MILLQNKKALFDYEILKTFEAGLLLEGWEVKSLRLKHGNIKAAWISTQDKKYITIENLQITPYAFSSTAMDQARPKALMVNKKELEYIQSQSSQKGVTVIPMKIYTKGKHIKCEIAIARGKQKHEKRQVLKERSMQKEAQKALKNF